MTLTLEVDLPDDLARF